MRAENSYMGAPTGVKILGGVALNNKEYDDGSCISWVFP
ncbi:hypothetical protein ACPOL_3322 [Acidisarcina polymorpha]|uniref:Uncharacterized protein n=1 Tax=Acidisarcina polymorpha TaxID=2211140 RepID=A0A2Z5G0C1_9BACT|nr:hypothetical protein ACPOL_3322 [Acidisarcina polymorpha]